MCDRPIDRQGEDDFAALMSNPFLIELLKISRSGCLEWSSGTGEIVCSHDIRRMFGYANGERLTVAGLFRRVHPADMRRAGQALRQPLCDGASLDFECRISSPGGDDRHLRFCLKAQSCEGAGYRLLGVVFDQTEQKECEARSRHWEKQLCLVVDAVPAIVWSTLPDGSNDFHNQRLLDYTGFSPEESSGSGWLNMIHPDDVDRHGRAWQAAVETGASFQCESRLRRCDGQYRWFLARAEPVRGDNGAIVKWYGTNIDIDDLKKTEQALHRSEAYLAEAQRLSRTGSFGWNAVSGTFFYCSREIFRIFEFAPADTIGIDEMAQRIHPDDRGVVEKTLRHAAERRFFDFQCRLLMPQGEIKHIHITAHRVERRPSDRHFLGAVSDITERVLKQEMLDNLRADFAHASRVSVLGELTASIAHEISQPLAAIAASSQAGLFWLDRQEPDLAEIHRLTAGIKESARRATDIIARIRSMASRKPPRQVVVSLDDVIREALTFLQFELQAREAQFVYHAAPIIPFVLADRIQIQQVVVNLLVNAMQALARKAERKITIRTDVVGVSRVVCRVEDTGMGISSENLPRLFESFFTTKENGMGIGLPLCRSILEAHGGDISAQNLDDGGGACFVFSLPLVEPPTLGP